MTELNSRPGRAAWRGSALLLLAFTLLLAAVAARLALMNRAGQSTGSVAPEFALDTFAHGRIEAQSLRGQVWLVNFWGSWCLPCHQEARDLQRIWERFRERDFLLIGVAYLDTENDARNYLDEYDIDYPNGLDIAQRNQRGIWHSGRAGNLP